MTDYEYQLQRLINLCNDLDKDLEWIRSENKRLADEATVLEAECIVRGIVL